MNQSICILFVTSRSVFNIASGQTDLSPSTASTTILSKRFHKHNYNQPFRKSSGTGGTELLGVIGAAGHGAGQPLTLGEDSANRHWWTEAGKIYGLDLVKLLPRSWTRSTLKI